jgi:hypothetical protein
MSESKVKNKKTIVYDRLFLSLEFDENMILIKGERDLAQADKVRKGKEKAMQKYVREHEALRMRSKEIWFNVYCPTEDNESNGSKATSEPPRKRKYKNQSGNHTQICLLEEGGMRAICYKPMNCYNSRWPRVMCELT